MSEVDEDLTAGHYLPTGEFVMRAAVRAYEPGASGQMGPGNLLRYCELVANVASAAAGFGPQWYAARGEGWVIFRQTIEMNAPIGLGQSLELMTWVRDFSRVASLRCYRLTDAATGAVVARTATTWAYVDRQRQTPRRIPPELQARIPRVDRAPLPPRPQWEAEDASYLPPAQVAWWARGYEADSLKHVNNCVYADWLSEAARLAFAGWAARDPRFQSVPLIRRLTLNYQRSALPGDAVTLTTTPERVGRRGIVLNQTIAPRDDPATPIMTATAWYVLTGSSQE
jgi:acyl-CoA thioesterase FadM